MAITYPTTLDSSVGPGPASANRGTTATNDATFPHGGAHADISAAVVALETKLGIDTSAVTTTVDYKLRRRFFNVWTANDANPAAATNYGVWTTRNFIPVLGFNDTTSYSSFFIGVCPPGAILTSGIVVRIKWMAATATTLKTVWGCSFERMNTDEDADSFDTEDTDSATATTCSGTSGIMVESVVTCTHIDSMTVGDAYRLKIARKVADANDTMVGDAQVVTVTTESAA